MESSQSFTGKDAAMMAGEVNMRTIQDEEAELERLCVEAAANITRPGKPMLRQGVEAIVITALKSILDWERQPESQPPDSGKLLQVRVAQMEEALREFIRVEESFGHAGQHTDQPECADCKRVRLAKAALGEPFV